MKSLTPLRVWRILDETCHVMNTQYRNTCNGSFIFEYVRASLLPALTWRSVSPSENGTQTKQTTPHTRSTVSVVVRQKRDSRNLRPPTVATNKKPATQLALSAHSIRTPPNMCVLLILRQLKPNPATQPIPTIGVSLLYYYFHTIPSYTSLTTFFKSLFDYNYSITVTILYTISVLCRCLSECCQMRVYSCVCVWIRMLLSVASGFLFFVLGKCSPLVNSNTHTKNVSPLLHFQVNLINLHLESLPLRSIFQSE